MNTITIEVNALKAIMLFTADVKEVRYYLKGIHLETGPEGARLTATNGHVLAAHFIPGRFMVSDGTIPGDLVANALKISGKATALDIEIEAGAYRPFYTLAGLRAEAIDGRYPDVMRIIPQSAPSGQCAQFDPEYVARWGKAAKLLGKGKYVGIAHDGPHNAALVDVGREDFFGVMMPRRQDGGALPTVPPWAFSKVNPPADTAKVA